MGHKQPGRVTWDKSFLKMIAQRMKKSCDRVFLFTKLQNMIFDEQYESSVEFQQIVADGTEALPAFESLCRDVFTALYTLVLKRAEPESLTEQVRLVHIPILDDLLKQDAFQDVKALCEGRDIPSFEATLAFCRDILQNLPELVKLANGEKDILKIINMLSEQREALISEFLSKAVEEKSPPGVYNNKKKLLYLVHIIDSKAKQTDDLAGKVAMNLIRNRERLHQIVKSAADAALRAAQDADNILSMGGNDDGDGKATQANRNLIDRAKKSENPLEIARILGKLRQIIAKKKKNSFTYGLGEKYDLTFGNDLNLCLSSEMAMLAALESQALFLKKFGNKALKQYRKRDALIKGTGDVIVCLDESGSMEPIHSWAKALALAMLKITTGKKRNFSLVHFGTKNEIQTDVFLPGKFTQDDVLLAAEHNFNGGTDFQTALSEVLKLVRGSFTEAEILFITDGENNLPKTFTELFLSEKAAHRFIVTAILMDKDAPAAGDSIKPFCDTIYHSSEMTLEQISTDILEKRT